jgi:hypothetical protein
MGAAGGRSEGWRVAAHDSSDEEDTGTIYTDLMGADEEENGDSSSTEEEEEEEDDDENEETQEEESEEEEGDVEMNMENYEVGDFVTAVYEEQWLLAQVDIDQQNAGQTHVNLAYMERIGKNQFKWPKQDDRLLTLKEDILFKCSHPIMVGSSIRAYNVGLPNNEAARADAALELVVCLQLAFLATTVPYLLNISTLKRPTRTYEAIFLQKKSLCHIVRYTYRYCTV